MFFFLRFLYFLRFCVFFMCHNFWTNKLSDLFSVSKWPSCLNLRFVKNDSVVGKKMARSGLKMRLFSQIKTCFHYREPCFHCRDPLNENIFFHLENFLTGGTLFSLQGPFHVLHLTYHFIYQLYSRNHHFTPPDLKWI